MIATDDRPLVNHDAKYRFKIRFRKYPERCIRMKGKVVMIRKYGWRIPIFSMYENVVSLKQVRVACFVGTAAPVQPSGYPQTG